MKTLFSFAERLAGPFLRISLGLVLLWIGSIHLDNPQPVVRLLSMSLPFLAFSAFVYVLSALEVIAGILLIAGLWVRYVALLSLVLFACIDTKRRALQQERGVESKRAGMTQVEQPAACVAKKELCS